jgi:hypothetical protein
MPNPYKKTDAAQDTNSSTKEVSRAWHDARDDAEGTTGVPEDRHHQNDRRDHDPDRNG